MFKARIRNYWCDYCQEYTEIAKGSIEEILEYFYDVYENSIYPGYRQFITKIVWQNHSANTITKHCLP